MRRSEVRVRASRLLAGSALMLAAAAFLIAGGTASAKTSSGPNCGDTVSGVVTLQSDLFCPGGGGLIVGSDFTTINLNGHKIVCINDSLPCASDSGIYTEYNQTTVMGPGTVSGFDTNVDMEGDTGLVQNLSTNAGPSASSEFGVYVSGSSNQVVHVTDTGGTFVSFCSSCFIPSGRQRRVLEHVYERRVQRSWLRVLELRRLGGPVP
jgi:hypothetical protein